MSDGAMKDTSSSFSLTQKRLFHSLAPQAQHLQVVPNVDECIWNVSMANLFT